MDIVEKYLINLLDYAVLPFECQLPVYKMEAASGSIRCNCKAGEGIDHDDNGCNYGSSDNEINDDSGGDNIINV